MFIAVTSFAGNVAHSVKLFPGGNNGSFEVLKLVMKMASLKIYFRLHLTVLEQMPQTARNCCGTTGSLLPQVF